MKRSFRYFSKFDQFNYLLKPENLLSVHVHKTE